VQKITETCGSTGKELKTNNMGAPYKMKYTNGKKADTTAFPFKEAPLKQMAKTPAAPEQGDISGMIAAKVDEKVEEKVNKVVNQEAGEGLV